MLSPEEVLALCDDYDAIFEEWCGVRPPAVVAARMRAIEAALDGWMVEMDEAEGADG